MAFPFAQPENTAVFTCLHVLEQGADICWVSHDRADGAWQFLCGRPHTPEDGRIVSLKNMVVLDPTLGELADLPGGGHAKRAGKGSPWQREKRKWR